MSHIQDVIDAKWCIATGSQRVAVYGDLSESMDYDKAAKVAVPWIFIVTESTRYDQYGYANPDGRSVKVAKCNSSFTIADCPVTKALKSEEVHAWPVPANGIIAANSDGTVPWQAGELSLLPLHLAVHVMEQCNREIFDLASEANNLVEEDATKEIKALGFKHSHGARWEKDDGDGYYNLSDLTEILEWVGMIQGTEDFEHDEVFQRKVRHQQSLHRTKTQRLLTQFNDVPFHGPFTGGLGTARAYMETWPEGYRHGVKFPTPPGEWRAEGAA